MNLYDMMQGSVTIFWFLIGIRQFKGTWGWLFIIMGITDIISRLYGLLPNQTPDRVYLSYAFLIICSLNYKFFDKNKYILIPISLLLIIPSIYLEHVTITLFSTLSDIAVLFYFGREFILALFNNNRLNLFFLSISSFAIIGIFKAVWLIILQWEGVDLFQLLNIFQVVVMLPFLFISHDDKRLSINMKRK